MTEAYPLSWPEGWPRTPSWERKSRHQLKATFDIARRKLYAEIQRLGASSCVISCNLSLRVNGVHNVDRADATMDEPGVAIYFHLDGKPMAMASDRYETPAANLRSVGLAVEYLRGLERHGGGHMMNRAFGGFAQLLPPTGAQPEVVDWRVELGPFPDGLDVATQLIIAEGRYRAKVKTTDHAAGGDHTAMIRLNAAIARAREELKDGQARG